MRPAEPTDPKLQPARGPRRVSRGLALLLLLLAVIIPSLPPRGPILVEILAPVPGAVVGATGVEIFIHFPPEGWTAAETFRALLNGADVTDAFTLGENGAHGRIHALLDGENVLRVEVFGRTPWNSDRLFEQSREVRFRMRRPLDLDRG